MISRIESPIPLRPTYPSTCEYERSLSRYSCVRQLPPRLFGEAPGTDFVERDGVFALDLQYRLIDQYFHRCVRDDSVGGLTVFAEVVTFGGDFLVYFEPVDDYLRGFFAIGACKAHGAKDRAHDRENLLWIFLNGFVAGHKPG